MDEYVKINTIWKRDERGKIQGGEYATEELAYLADLPWEWTEKVDGTNVRVGWDGAAVAYGGRTDNSQLSMKLIAALRAKFENLAPFVDVFNGGPAVLYGEGYGAGIQKGETYRADPGFVLFDVQVGRWWLRRPDVEEVARQFGLDVVPIVGRGSLSWASETVRSGALRSLWGDFEGLVGRPAIDLFDRKGERIMAKIKAKDFR